MRKEDARRKHRWMLLASCRGAHLGVILVLGLLPVVTCANVGRVLATVRLLYLLGGLSNGKLV